MYGHKAKILNSQRVMNFYSKCTRALTSAKILTALLSRDTEALLRYVLIVIRLKFKSLLTLTRFLLKILTALLSRDTEALLRGVYIPREFHDGKFLMK